jgi:hypothetical protein
MVNNEEWRKEVVEMSSKSYKDAKVHLRHSAWRDVLSSFHDETLSRKIKEILSHMEHDTTPADGGLYQHDAWTSPQVTVTHILYLTQQGNKHLDPLERLHFILV